ncbi:hypothetical protein ADL21_38035 [Streptomyces albus subsp. albus]|nr:hypothetical protein ADL21_38035 [Streptomyces albus subsp. albus]
MGLVVVVESVPYLLFGCFDRKLLARFASFRALAAVEAIQVVIVGAMPWLWPSLGLAGVLVVIVAIGIRDALTGPNPAALPAERLFLVDAATFLISAAAFAWLGYAAAVRSATAVRPSPRAVGSLPRRKPRPAPWLCCAPIPVSGARPY